MEGGSIAWLMMSQSLVKELNTSKEKHLKRSDFKRETLQSSKLRHQLVADIFKKFIDQDGKFEETLTNNVQGLPSLSEVSHLGVRGEEILEEALPFTTTRLEFMVPNLSNNLLEAFSQPIRKAMPRLDARNYIFINENNDAHNDLLLNTKLDFNALQKLHQRYLSERTRYI
ncbi:sesquiterpene synthase 12-like [Lycium ferocissimum]|uniref:sesquiterpene synthase 12-like n=1 Tax=Lycium ferocissimum TaxID=112874 RepID=UPI002814C33B|nr:sesquiterpene synthase 12-like [Lycium ferocissimum]